MRVLNSRFNEEYRVDQFVQKGRISLKFVVTIFSDNMVDVMGLRIIINPSFLGDFLFLFLIYFLNFLAHLSIYNRLSNILV